MTMVTTTTVLATLSIAASDANNGSVVDGSADLGALCMARTDGDYGVVASGRP